MNDTNQCPRCGSEIAKDAPQGLCPKCLMANALGSESPEPSYVPTVTSDPNATRPDRVNLGSLEGDIPAAPEPAGKYSILGEHGKGGMGRVLLVHDEHLGRDIALKELLPDLGDGSTPTPARHSKEMAARFLREAKITGQLEHPSITPVHEIGRREDGTLYYTMKLVRGRTLSQAIKSAKNFEERLKLLPHFVDLCNAIAYAHSRGVIHRDIKPSNVMIGDYGETVIIDWGLAKVKSARDASDPPSTPGQKTILGMRTNTKLDDDSGKTQHGQAMGTPAYMSPEQATGDLDNIDERSDIYSLGVVLFEILTGQTPVEGKSVAEILRNVIAGKIRKIQDLELKCPKELIAIVKKGMGQDSEGRYRSAKDLADAVVAWRPRREKTRVRIMIERSVAVGIAVIVVATIVANVISARKLQGALEGFEAAGFTLDVDEYLSKYKTSDRIDTDNYAHMNAAGFLYHFEELYKGRGVDGGSLRPISGYWESILSAEKLTRQQYEELKELTVQHSGIRVKLHEFSTLPPSTLQDFVGYIGMTDSGLWSAGQPDDFTWRVYGVLLVASAYCDWYEGDMDGALNNCATALLVAQVFLQDPTLETKITAFILMDFPFLFLNAHQEVLAEAKPEALASFVAILENLEIRNGLKRAWAYQAIYINRTLHTMKHGKLDPINKTRVIDDLFGRTGPGGTKLPQNTLALAKYHAYCSILMRWAANNDQSALLEFHQTLLSLSEKPYFEIESDELAARTQFLSSTWTWQRYRHIGDILYYVARAETIKNSLALTALVNIHKIRSGQYPNRLDELDIEALPRFNVEYLTGQPFEYRIVESGFQIRPTQEANDRFRQDVTKPPVVWGSKSD